MLLRRVALGFTFVLAACPSPAPGPVGPRTQPQATTPTNAPLHPPWPATTAPPPAGGSALTGNPEMPIDPAKPMPAQSVSTSAVLELGKPTTVMVDGRADVFSSGLAQPDQGRGGKLPALLTLVAGGGYVTFSSVKGVVGCMAGATSPPDGGTCAGGNTDIRAANGISGIIDHERTQFLVGVFLGPSPSGATRAPATLDFSAANKGDSFAELSPLIGQTFFIGDGFTRSGLSQRFMVPAGATRLFLAFADAFSFQGAPGAYDDNTGGFAVTLTQAK